MPPVWATAAFLALTLAPGAVTAQGLEGTFEEGVLLQGQSYFLSHPSTASPLLCQFVCQIDVACRVWVFGPPALEADQSWLPRDQHMH